MHVFALRRVVLRRYCQSRRRGSLCQFPLPGAGRVRHTPSRPPDFDNHWTVTFRTPELCENFTMINTERLADTDAAV